jgi:hypothetical protein
MVSCTMLATVDVLAVFYTVPDDPALTMRTERGQGVNRALKGVKDVVYARHRDGERLVRVVSANFTTRHGITPGSFDVVGRFVLLLL